MIPEKLNNFPVDSRLWIYTSNRIIGEQDQLEIETELKEFLANWSSHGTPLNATSVWLNCYQIGIVLDQSSAGASGCSIDKQTRKLREIGAVYHIDWFDRMWMIIQENEEVKRISFFDIGEHKDALLFDPLIQSLEELKKWPIPITESRYKQF